MPKTPNDIAPEVPELQENRAQHNGPEDSSEANDSDEDTFADDMDSSETDQDGLEGTGD
jgi:hypothetical protein